MIIKPKFQVGQKVFCIHNDTIGRFKIREINIRVVNKIDPEINYTLIIDDVSSFKKSERYIGETKQDLLDKL